ncbi:hypothetical protein HMPREF1554_00324 [Porphyromonas gingivalis F0569]|nr:hypothetical protein HMPREF1554_00324 [Porphyromonas gingivalis F0569]
MLVVCVFWKCIRSLQPCGFSSLTSKGKHNAHIAVPKQNEDVANLIALTITSVRSRPNFPICA